jgi:hypothetical protein
VRASVRTVESPIWTSDVEPSIWTSSESLAEVIAWADERPVAYRVVTTTRSKAFGLGASTYLGWAQRGVTSEAVLCRLEHLRRSADPSPAKGKDLGFWALRARFTIARFNEAGFTGGLFQEHARWTNGKEYPRHCTYLDYTPRTLERVIDRFVRWCDEPPCRYENRTRITIDGRDARTFEVGK